MDEETRKKYGLTPADDFTEKVLEAASVQVTADGNYEYIVMPPEAIEELKLYEEIDAEDLEHELEAQEKVNMLRNEAEFDAEREAYIASIRKAVHEHRVNYNDMDPKQTVKAMHDVLKVVNDEFDEGRLKCAKIIHEYVTDGITPRVFSPDEYMYKDFFSNMDAVLEIVNKYKTGKRAAADPKRMRKMIYEAVKAICYTCSILLREWQNYKPEDIETIIAWYNNLYAYPEYLHLYRDDYFAFVINFCNMELRKGADISDVYVVAMNNLVNINIKVLNIILKEKSEQYAPVVNYVKNMKKGGKL